MGRTLVREVGLKLFAETAKAQAELDAIMAEAVKLGELNPEIKPQIEKAAALRQMAVLRGELKAQGDAAGKDLGTGIREGTQKGLGGDQRGGSWIAGAIGLGAPLAGPLAAGGLAFTAFGALAAGSLAPVVKAMTGPGGLEAGWATLDNRQRHAALGVEALKTHYDQLAKSMEPRAFQVFNTLLQTADGLLGPLAKLAAASGGAIEHFLVQFENDSGLKSFIGYSSTVAPQAIRLLGEDVTTLVHTVLTFAKAAGGVGLFELRVLTAGLQALDKVVSALPGPVSGLAFAVGGLALVANKIGVLGGLLKITGLAGMAGAAKAAVIGMNELSIAEKGAAASGAALDAVSPLGWVILATAAVGGLVFWLNSMGTATGRTIKTLEDQQKAVGLNTRGYEDAAAAIGQYAQSSKGASEQLVNLHTGMVTGTTDAGRLSGATAQLTGAQEQLLSGAREQASFWAVLEKKYGLTEQGARSLAQASGVLADKTGHIVGGFKNAVTQTEAYANSNLKAQRPTTQLAKDIQDYANKTLTATARTKALTDALTLFFDPAVTADQDTIQLKNDQIALAKALDASGGKTGLLTQKQRDARDAFDTYISQVAQTAQDTFSATGKTSDYRKVIEGALPALEKAAGHNKKLRQEIQDLIGTMKKLRAESVNITVNAKGFWKVTGALPGGGRQPGGPHPVAARGMFIASGTPGVDDQLIRAQKGELVVPAPLVRAGAVDHLHGRIPGFASGGVVGKHSGLAGMAPWMRSEDGATLRALEKSVAAVTAAAIRAAMAGAGGGGFGTPGPGGGQPAQNAALARRMFPSVDFASWNYVAMRESGWNQFARNPSSGAYGIPQALPPSKMGPAANPPQSNVMAQLSWMVGYMNSRYGGAGGAAAHERAFNWYDSGTQWLPPGPSLAWNGTGRPERVGGEDLAPLLRQVIAELRKLPGVQAAQMGRVLSGRPVAPRPSVFAAR